MKVKITENGYYIEENSMYLDEAIFKLNKEITFKEFDKEFMLPLGKYETEWCGNNPFRKSESLLINLENTKARVEIDIIGKEISIYKVLQNEYSKSNELIRDLGILDILYEDTLESVKNAVKNLEEN